MNWSNLPPLSALRAFSAYADKGSVAAAGDALNVSHAAISQQMRSLENHMGLALLDRRNRQLSLTAEGQALAYALGEGFGKIIETTEALTGADENRPLQVACTPSFAAFWLMPRLAGFRASHPDIDMMIDPNPQLTDPQHGGIDLAIRYGNGIWPGLEATLLMTAPLVVVAAPTLFPKGVPDTPEALLDYPWLHELGRNETTRWLTQHGISADRTVSATHVPGNLMIDGVRSGQGIAIATRMAVEEDIAAGRLLALFEEDSDKGYHLLTRPGVQRSAVTAFVRWIRREAR